MKRRIIQIAAIDDYENDEDYGGRIVALANDGTLWLGASLEKLDVSRKPDNVDWHWTRIPPLPQPEDDLN